MSRAELWVQSYMARLAGGATHNDAVYAANVNIELLMKAYAFQVGKENAIIQALQEGRDGSN